MFTLAVVTMIFLPPTFVAVRIHDHYVLEKPHLIGNDLGSLQYTIL